MFEYSYFVESKLIYKKISCLLAHRVVGNIIYGFVYVSLAFDAVFLEMTCCCREVYSSLCCEVLFELRPLT